MPTIYSTEDVLNSTEAKDLLVAVTAALRTATISAVTPHKIGSSFGIRLTIAGRKAINVKIQKDHTYVAGKRQTSWPTNEGMVTRVIKSVYDAIKHKSPVEALITKMEADINRQVYINRSAQRWNEYNFDAKLTKYLSNDHGPHPFEKQLETEVAKMFASGALTKHLTEHQRKLAKNKLERYLVTANNAGLVEEDIIELWHKVVTSAVMAA
jgi:hypothetical protein